MCIRDRHFLIRPVNGEQSINAYANGAVELYHDNVLNLKTNANAVYVSTSADQGRLRLADTSGNIAYQITGTDVASSGESGGRMVVQDALGGMVLDFRTAGGNIFCYNTIKLNGNATADNLKLIMGAGEDLQLFHDGSSSRINASNGALVIQAVTQHDIALTHAGENMLVAKADGAVELYHDGNRQVFTIDGGMNWQDNKKAEFGNSGDLKIYHDGSTSIISSPSHAIAHYSNTRHHFLNYDGSANVAVLSPQGQCDFYNNGTLKLEVEGNGIQVHNGGLDLNRQAQPYSAAIYFAGFGDTNHMLWHDYFDNPNGTRGTGNGFDGIKWNVYAGIHFYKGNEAETIASLLADGACKLYYNNGLRFETSSPGATVYGSLTQTSDIALKTDIQPLTNVLDKIKQITGYKYQFKETGHDSMGVTAQDVEKVFPEIVKGSEGEKTLEYNGLVGALVEAVKELSTKNDALETRIKTLEE